MLANPISPLAIPRPSTIATMTAELELTAADLVCGVDFGSQDLEPDSCTKLEPTDLPVELPKRVDAILLEELGVFLFTFSGVLNNLEP